MKSNITLGIIGWLLASLGGYKAIAQEVPTAPPAPGQKETQEVIIRKKGDKDVRINVEITKDKVLLNGKPLVEFNEEGVTVNNRKMIIRDGNKMIIDLDGKMMDLDMKLKELEGKNFNFNFDTDEMHDGESKSYTFLGVNSEKDEKGARITGMTKDGPAEKAGLKEGDIIYKIEETTISSSAALAETIRGRKDGEKVKIYYLRDGKKKDLKATLGTRKDVNIRKFNYKSKDGSVKSFSMPPMPPMAPMPPMPPMTGEFGEGIHSDNMFQRMPMRQKLGLKIQDTDAGDGIKILEVEAGSAAATAGLMKDDLITEIGGKKVKNTDEAREELQQNREKTVYDIKARRNGSEMTFNIKIPKKLKTANL